MQYSFPVPFCKRYFSKNNKHMTLQKKPLNKLSHDSDIKKNYPRYCLI